MPRILFVTQVLPWPLRRNGGAQRTAVLLSAMRRWGEVDLVAVGAVDPKETPPSPAELEAAGVVATFDRAKPVTPDNGSVGGPIAKVRKIVDDTRRRHSANPEIVAWLRGRLAQTSYGLIVGRYLRPSLEAGLDQLTGIPKILDFDDVDWMTLQCQLEAEPWPGLKGRIGGRLVVRELKRICREALHRFDHIWVTSDEDLALTNGAPATVLPNIPFALPGSARIEPCLPAAESREVLFVGDLEHGPNRRGLERFLDIAWPIVRQAEPQATLRIVGRGMSDETQRRWAAIPGVNPDGFVDDLRDAYARSALTIAPVFWGGGTKIKVLESLAYGRACVTTPYALRGYQSLVAAGGVYRADDEQGMAKGCIELLRDPARRQLMVGNGSRVVAEQFSVKRIERTVDQTMVRLGFSLLSKVSK